MFPAALRLFLYPNPQAVAADHPTLAEPREAAARSKGNKPKNKQDAPFILLPWFAFSSAGNM
jgi:hypothetical protein